MEAISKYVAMSEVQINLLVVTFLSLDLYSNMCPYWKSNEKTIVMYCSGLLYLSTSTVSIAELVCYKLLMEEHFRLYTIVWAARIFSWHLINMFVSTGVCVSTLKAWMKKVKIICPSIFCWSVVQRVRFEQSSSFPSWMLKERKQKQWVYVAIYCCL